MSFHASVWLHAARALLCSYGAASGHVGPKSFPGAAPRRLRFGHSSTNNRNGGQYGYYQFAGLLPILYIGLPQLGVSASYGYSDGITLNGKSDGIASFAALASLKIPIYHWGEGRNKVKAMKAEEEMVRLKKEETEQMMQLEVARARYNVEDAATRVRLTRRSLSQAEENLQVSKNRFEVGMETLTNYMEAQAQWQKAWSDWIEAKAELRVNETYYLKSTGRLSD